MLAGLACILYENSPTETAFSYVGGGLPGGDKVDVMDVDRRELSGSLWLADCVFDELQSRKIGGERWNPPQTRSVAGCSWKAKPLSRRYTVSQPERITHRMLHTLCFVIEYLSSHLRAPYTSVSGHYIINV